jgi:uncharacterized OB-fold protein
MSQGSTDPLHWPLVEEYLAHAAAERLMIPVCAACEATHFPPRALCPYCLSEAVSLRRSAGAGTLYSFSIVHLDYHPEWGERTPYVNALVSLADGPTVFANIVDCDPATLAVGDPVEATFLGVGGQPRPVFRPTERGTSSSPAP